MKSEYSEGYSCGYRSGFEAGQQSGKSILKERQEKMLGLMDDIYKFGSIPGSLKMEELKAMIRNLG